LHILPGTPCICPVFLEFSTQLENSSTQNIHT